MVDFASVRKLWNWKRNLRVETSTKRSWVQNWGYNLTRQFAQLAGVTLCGMRCEGREHLPKNGAVLVCSNHQSYFDPIIVGLACRRRLNYLARKTLFRHPLFSHIIRFYDAIPIDRDGVGAAGIKETIRRLRREELVLIFPEGTRTSDGELQRLRPGFCSLARRGQTALQPVGLDGAYQSWPRQAKSPRLDRISVVFGPPITPTDVASMDNAELIAELADRMAKCHRRARELRT